MRHSQLLLATVLVFWMVTTGLPDDSAKPKDRPRIQVPPPVKALCVLKPVGESKVAGTVTFVQRNGFVEVTAEIRGLTPGKHGFHIHEFGDCSAPDAASAGGHFNPTNMPHAGPDAFRRHVGDLGNVVAEEDGQAVYKLNDKLLRLGGPLSIVGHSIIVHGGEDDLTTQPSGNAGPRVACGVIGVAKPDDAQ